MTAAKQTWAASTRAHVDQGRWTPVDATQGPDQCRRPTQHPWDAGRRLPQVQRCARRQTPRKPAALNTARGHINAAKAAAGRVATMPDGLLSQEHEAALAAAKRKLREENEEYIRQHPELRGAIRLLMAKLLDDTPEDLQQYVCEFFTDPDLERKVEEFMLQKV